jgi:hypothetical protein
MMDHKTSRKASAALKERGKSDHEKDLPTRIQLRHSTAKHRNLFGSVS